MIGLSEVYDMPAVVVREKIKRKAEYPASEQNFLKLFLFGSFPSLVLIGSVEGYFFQSKPLEALSGLTVIFFYLAFTYVGVFSQVEKLYPKTFMFFLVLSNIALFIDLSFL